jgi:hypothetical protein
MILIQETLHNQIVCYLLQIIIFNSYSIKQNSNVFILYKSKSKKIIKHMSELLNLTDLT